MYRSAILFGLAVLVVIAPPSAASSGRITLAHGTYSGTELTLEVARELSGPDRYRDADFALVSQPPDRVDADGGILSEGSGMLIPSRVAERGRPPLSLDVVPESCAGRLVLAGTASSAVTRVKVLDADGTTTPVRLRTSPSGWHYAGHVIGAFLPTRSAPRSARAYDRAGRLLVAVKLPHVAACTPPDG
jgi:hypothetical protein